MKKKRILKSKENSSDTEDSEIESEEAMKKPRIKSSTEDEESDEMNHVDNTEDLQSSIEKDDRTEDQDVDQKPKLNLKTNEKSSYIRDIVKMENDEDTDACFSSDEENQTPLTEEISHQKQVMKNESNTSKEDFQSKVEIETKEPKSSSDEDEPVRKKKRESNESSYENNPKKSKNQRKFADSSSEDDQPVKRKKPSIKQKTSIKHNRRNALESSEDDEFAEDDEAFEEVEIKPPPKTCVIDEARSKEISKIFEKIHKKWTNLGKVDQSFYLRFKIKKPLDLPNDQQYRKLIKLPNTLHHSPKCCLILKDDPEEWSKIKDEIENKIEWKGLGRFEVVQLNKYRKRTKGAIKRRKFLKDFDMLIADNRISKLMRTNFGREAYKNKKIPFSVKLGTKLKSQIEDVYRKTQLILGDKKNEFDVIFGRSKNTNEVLIENLQYLIDNLDKIIPYGFSNISQMQIRALSVQSCSFYEYDPSDTIWNDLTESSKVERPLVERIRGMAYKDHKEDELEQRKTRRRMKLKRKRQMESSKRFGGLFAKKRKMMAG